MSRQRKDRKTKAVIYALAIVCAFIIISVSFNRLSLIADSLLSGNRSQSPESHRVIDKSENTLLLVNASHEYQKQPSDLVSVFDYKSRSYLVKDKNVLLKKEAISALNDMMDDFQKETGLNNINVISGYRSVETQQELYSQYMRTRGKAYTKKYVQKPGASEHHTGYAVDFSIYYRDTGKSEDFKGQGEYGWITKNAYKYGFILRYPQDKAEITGIAYEPWHFRYVGKKAAKYIDSHSLCLEEYVNRG